MDKRTQIPCQIIDRKTALASPDLKQLTEQWDHSPQCFVAYCQTCRADWRFDQLKHEPIGYYPGDPISAPLFPNHPDPKMQPSPLDHGNRYAHGCPICFSDLTPLVEIHMRGCTAPTQRNGLTRTPPNP